MTAPFLVTPTYVVKPWGGRRLATGLGRGDLPSGPVGESWEVADTDDCQSVVETGSHAGRLLRDVWGRPFPLLLKVLDAQEHLSVQVHPDGRDGEPAKEEAWIGLADGGTVAIGTVSPDMAPEEMLAALDQVPLQGGDAEHPPSLVHVPPGTVHAIMAGTLVFEVQNAVDLTWRLYDHGRMGTDGAPRTLHVQEAAAVLARGAPPAAALDPRTHSMRGTRFGITLLPPGSHAAPQGIAAFMVGGGRVESDAGGLDVPRGRTVILPPGVTSITSAGWTVLCAE